jgi:hypothetical protein
MGLYNFKAQFVPFILDGTKTHTIRAPRRYPSKPGDTLYLYTGLRQKGARRLMLATCVRVERIDIIAIGPGKPARVFVEHERLSRDECDQLAYRDGFRDSGGRGSFAQMMQFWEGRLPFTGQIIHWRAEA